MNKIRNIFQDRQVMAQALYYFGIAVILLLLGLINFAEATFDAERLLDGKFWFQYAITIISGLIVFLCMEQASKLKYRQNVRIVRLYEELTVYHNYIASTDGLWKKLFEHLEADNKRTRLDTYIHALKIERQKKAKTLEEEKRYDELIANAEEDIKYKNIKCIEKTTNLIFAGVSMKRKNEELEYTGKEKRTEFLLPAIALGVTIVALALSFVLTPAKTTVEHIIQFVVRLVSILSYVFKGREYAEYSILTRLKIALEARLAVVTSFLDGIGYRCEIAENPYYAFKVDKGESAE